MSIKKGINILLLCLIVAMSFGEALLAETPKDVLVVAQIAEPKSLDPQAVTAVNDFRILMNVYDGLVKYKTGTLSVEPSLATSWKISRNGLNYTFKLRKGVTFHDGNPFDAEAVKFNFDRMLKEDHPYADTGPFPLAFFFSAIDEVKVIDTYTVRFVLKEPFAPLLSNLAYPTGLIVSPEAVKTYGKGYGRNPSGTGPFKFREWKGNQHVIVDRNENYWNGKPNLKSVVFRPIVDANTRVAEMLSRGVDLIVEVPPDNVETFSSDSRFKLYEQAGPHLWFLILNAKEGPFKSKKVRQAVNYAINKKALVENVLRNTATIATGPTPAAFSWAYNKSLKPYPYNPRKARQLIKEAGFEGATITFYVTEGGSGMLDPVSMGTAIQADLKAVGLNVEIETYEWNTFLGKVNPGLEGKADMAEMAWMTNDPDTLPFLALRTAAWPDKGGFNSGYYSNPKVDKLLESARKSTSIKTRARLYKQMQKIVYDDSPWAFIANWKQNAVAGNNVKNFKLEPSFLLQLHKVAK